ncbi:helix-turn-helix domain-containing protein [Streptococcus pluranimalium]
MLRLKELRKKKGITLKELSQILKERYNLIVSDGQLSNYENEKRRPRDESMWSDIADYFGVSVPYLLGYSDKIMTFSSGEEFEKYRNKLLDKHKQSLIEEEKQFLEDFFKLEENDKQIIRYLTKNLRKKKPNN